jgi:hypothetical protein
VAYDVPNDKKIHNGATNSKDDCAIISVSTKQKVNTRSSTEVNLVSIDDIVCKVFWILVETIPSGIRLGSQ